jgi:two-component system OmpR family response regulator
MSVILLVDDNDDLRKIFTLFLSRKGHTVHSVPGGRECLDILATVVPDIILLDIMMPDMDGWETLLAIKQDPATRALPVSMCSGKLPDMEEIDRYGRFIEEYLVKPQELSLLSDTIVRIVKRYKERTEKIAHLKLEVPDHHLVDEFYDCQKTLYILDKFSRFFTGDAGKSESAVQRYIARMNEIRNFLDPPDLFGALEQQPETRFVHSIAGTPVDHVTGGPKLMPDDGTKWTPHPGPAGRHNES